MRTQTIEPTANIRALLSDILSELRSSRVSDDLWTADDIAAYLKVSPKTIYAKVVNSPNFPAPLRPLSVGNSKGDRRWQAKEVKMWALRFKESVK